MLRSRGAWSPITPKAAGLRRRSIISHRTTSSSMTRRRRTTSSGSWFDAFRADGSRTAPRGRSAGWRTRTTGSRRRRRRSRRRPPPLHGRTTARRGSTGPRGRTTGWVTGLPPPRCTASSPPTISTRTTAGWCRRCWPRAVRRRCGRSSSQVPWMRHQRLLYPPPRSSAPSRPSSCTTRRFRKWSTRYGRGGTHRRCRPRWPGSATIARCSRRQPTALWTCEARSRSCAARIRSSWRPAASSSHPTFCASSFRSTTGR